MWPRCNLAASQRRLYCGSVNSHSPMGLVSRQWDAVDWSCVLCDRSIHNDRASRSASSHQCACPLYSSRVGFFLGKTSHHPGLSAPLQPRFGSLQLLVFPKAKIPVEREEVCDCDSHTVHKLSQRRLTTDWLAPRESKYTRTHSKVSSDWLPRGKYELNPAVKKLYQLLPKVSASRVSVASWVVNPKHDELRPAVSKELYQLHRKIWVYKMSSNLKVLTQVCCTLLCTQWYAHIQNCWMISTTQLLYHVTVKCYCQMFKPH